MSAQVAQPQHSENAVPQLEFCDATADGLNYAREVHAENRLRSEETANETTKEGRMWREHAAIGSPYRGRMNRDQDLAVTLDGLGHLPDFKDVWRAIAWADNRFHGGQLSTSICCCLYPELSVLHTGESQL